MEYPGGLAPGQNLSTSQTQNQVYFHIPRSIPKPGMILANEDNYNILLQRMTNLKKADPTINIDITEQAIDKVGGKENAGLEANEGQPKKKRKQVRAQSYYHQFLQ